MIGHRRSTRTYPRRSERGSALVELAVVAVFLVTVIGATFDYGTAWRSSLALNEATRTGARVGSAQGKSLATDFNALSGAKAALASSDKLQFVTRVVVFRSTADGKVPSACKAPGGTDPRCQIITGDKFRTNWQSLVYTSAVNAEGCLLIADSRNWCPTTRLNDQNSAQYYGIWIQMRQPFSFPIVGAGQTIERSTTMRLEPSI